jgi:hypothetical protein
MALGTFEENDLITTRAAHPTLRPFAGTFDKNFHVLSKQVFVAPTPDLIDYRQ